MKLLVIGAYGLIGSHVTARLLADGHEVAGVGRAAAAARRQVPAVHWIEADIGRMDETAWVPHLAGVQAVINCAGALQDSPRDDLEGVHVRGLMALARAATVAGVRRFVHISALGLENGSGAFSRTKAAGETALMALDLDWVILRPGLVLARSAYGGSSLLRGLAALPLAVPAVHADKVVQVVSAEDVAACAVRAAAPDAPARLAVSLASAEPTTLAQILAALRAWLGIAPAPVLALPAWLARLGSSAADALAWLGWRSALRSSALAQLAAGVRGEPDPDAARLGFQPRTLQAILAAWPSGVQERWFARLYFAKPLILATLAAFWLVSGLVGFLSRDQAVGELTVAGFDTGMARLFVIGGAIADVLLGLAVCWRRTAPLALKGMILLTLGYLAGSAVWRPDLWADPLGPMVKSIPTAVLALAALAILEDR